MQRPYLKADWNKQFGEGPIIYIIDDDPSGEPWVIWTPSGCTRDRTLVELIEEYISAAAMLEELAGEGLLAVPADIVVTPALQAKRDEWEAAVTKPPVPLTPALVKDVRAALDAADEMKQRRQAWSLAAFIMLQWSGVEGSA